MDSNHWKRKGEAGEWFTEVGVLVWTTSDEPTVSMWKASKREDS